MSLFLFLSFQMPRKSKKREASLLVSLDSDSDDDLRRPITAYPGEEVAGPDGYDPASAKEVRDYKKETGHRQYIKDCSYTMGLIGEVLKEFWPEDYLVSTGPKGWLQPTIRSSRVHREDLKKALFVEFGRLQFQCLPSKSSGFFSCTGVQKIPFFDELRLFSLVYRNSHLSPETLSPLLTSINFSNFLLFR